MRMKIEQIVLLFVVIALGYVLFTVYDEFKTQTIAAFDAQQTMLARQAAKGIEKNFTYYFSKLESLSATEQVATFDDRGREMLRVFYDKNSGDFLALIRHDSTGEILFDISEDNINVHETLGRLDRFRAVIESKRPYISDVFTSTGGPRCVACIIPVFSNKTFTGGLAVWMPIDDVIGPYLEKIRICKNGYAFLIDRQGKVVYNPIPYRRNHKAEKPKVGFLLSIAYAENGTSVPDSLTAVYDQVRQMKMGQPFKLRASYAPIEVENINWSVVVVTPEDEILSTMTGFRNKILFIGILLLGAMIAYSYSIIRSWIVVNEERKRKQAEEALRKSEERYRTIFERSRDIFYITTKEGGIIDINPAGSEVFGYTREEFKRLNVTVLYANPDDRENIKETLEKHGVVKDREVEYVRKSGRRIVCVNTADTWRDDQGNIRGYIGSLRDITEAKKTQKEKEELEKQLLHAQKMEAVGTLASGLAHDFNNLLQAVSGYIQLLQVKGEKDKTKSKYLIEADGAIDRAAELVSHLMTFSRKVDTELIPMDLNQAVEHSVMMLKRTLPKMISIESFLDKDLQPIRGDSIQMEQILMNLGSNAMDAMKEGGKLVIKTENATLTEAFCKSHLNADPGNYVLLSMSDTGSGMDRETMDHIFDPFYTTKGISQGTGLGLAMVYGIVKNHHGIIICDSQPGQGATFQIYFPAAPVDRSQIIHREHDEKDLRGGPETLLLVDDEENIREVSSEILTAYGYTVLTADSGEQALELYNKNDNHIELIILDLGMPGMGGQNCLNEIKRLDPQAKVIIASGYSVDGKIKNTIGSAADVFLAKPYRLESLIRAVRQVLDH